MTTTVRAIQQEDKAVWEDLWHQYNVFYKRVDSITQEITDTTFTRMLDPNTRIYGAVALDSSSKPIGFVHWYPHPSTSSIEEQVYLHDLFVDPESRNGGVGRKLIEHVYEHSKEAGAKSVYWHTQFFNHRAQLMYVKVADRTDFVQYRKML